ncbi:hypothetical protein DMN91_004107 [Ooceraea biroi]|uniref:Endonuclease/exonuclease/phosphatase domain-containing protein n=1 Tax=Ooceraea biroi TaxID=2015173 RepID=A0A3L8DVE3_OOCBI|nr:hypothetical protein DMN91_004107 [Ooceraea biroi]
MSDNRKVCKGCNTIVAKPIVCIKCGIASHPACIPRTGHPYLNGKFLDCTACPADAGLSGSAINKIRELIRSEFAIFRREIVESLKADIGIIREDMQKLAERIDGLENVERRASDGVSLAEEDLFAEIAERESRASNIIMFSLDEPEHSDSNDVSDKDLVNDVLHTILPSLEPSYKVRRLGVKKHGQPRPLCVSFSSKQEAILVLRNKGKYTGPAKIYQDQTPKQRKESASGDCVRGGGVLIAVRDIYPSRALNICESAVEHLYIDVQIGHKHIVFGAVYIPPGSDTMTYESHCSVVEDICSKSRNIDLVIAGDYNLPHLVVGSDVRGVLTYEIKGRCNMLRQANTLVTHFNELQLYQHNFVSNVTGNTLDLVFSTVQMAPVCLAVESLLSCDKYHPALDFTLPCSKVELGCGPRVVKRNFSRANYVAINDYLGGIHWDVELEGLSVESAVGLLYSHLDYAASSYVPVCTIRPSTYPRWFTRELIALVKSKRRAHYTFKRTNLFSDYLVFSNARSQCKALSGVVWRDYVGRTENSIPNNINNFWNFINTITNKGSSPPYVYRDGVHTSDEIATANHFADFFESVYNNNSITCGASNGSILIDMTGHDVGRLQAVRFNNALSRDVVVTSGVLQRSHLGPLLFNIFINDIKHVFENSNFLLYADDLKPENGWL